jgi:hypothetical protein
METMLVMVRTLFNSSKTGLPDWLSDYPMLLTQFLFYLYHNVPDFIPAFMTSEVLTALVGTLFPLCNNNDSTRYVYEVMAYHNICFDFFQLCLPEENNNKYSKFDTSKLMSHQGHWSALKKPL